MAGKSPRLAFDLTIVIPAYSEEKRIGKTLDELARYLRTDKLCKKMRVEVLVVAADAPDKTKAIVRAKKPKFSKLVLLQPGPKAGKGRDVQYGMLRASGAAVIFMDADLATPLRHLPRFYQAWQSGADVVIATRNLLNHHPNPVRRFVSNIGNFFFRIASGLWIEDTQCGFKLFSRPAARLCFSKLKIMGWGFDFEILAIARANKLTIKSYRVDDWVSVPGGTFAEGIFKNAFVSLGELVYIFWNRLRQMYVDRQSTSLWLLNRALCFWVIFTLFWLLSWGQLNTDFGWHQMAGQYFLTHGIPQHDVFSYTARGFPWVDHEWANDILQFVLYGIGGYGLLNVLYSALWSAALLIVGWRARFVTLLIAAIALLPYVGLRPIAWTLCFMAILLQVLQSRRQRLAWCLPALFLLWANLHGGFIIGLVILGYFVLLDRRRYLLVILTLCGLVTLINPYGPQVYVEIARTIFDPEVHSQISEWVPLVIERPSLPFVVLWLIGSLVFTGWRPQKWLRPSTLLLLAALSATRNLPLFVIAALQEFDSYWRQAWQAIPKRLSSPQKLLIAASVGSLTIFLAQGVYASYWPFVEYEAPYPASAVTYLQKHGCEGGQLFNAFVYGGYLIWKLPAQPVYIDGRMTNWRGPDGQKYLTTYIKILRGQTPYKAEFTRYNIRCALLERNAKFQLLAGQLRADHWTTAVQTPDSVLLLAPR